MTTLEWITKLPGVLEACPAKLAIGEPLTPDSPKNKKPPEAYDDAVWYRREFDAPAGAAKPGKHVKEMLYVVGPLPRCENGIDSRVCFTVAGDAREWYLVGGLYGTTEATRRKPQPATEYNPFGNFFMLAPYDDADLLPAYKGQKVDHYEERPYRRVPLRLERLQPCQTTTPTTSS